MITFNHNGTDYVRGTHHWFFIVRVRRDGVVRNQFRRLTPERNGPLLDELEEALQRKLRNLQRPS